MLVIGWSALKTIELSNAQGVGFSVSVRPVYFDVAACKQRFGVDFAVVVA
jgi:hypothetical protein